MRVWWLGLLAAAPAVSGAVTLARDGTTRHVIVVAADAPAPDRTAGVELAEHLNAATGVTFRVVEEAPAGAPAIFVGLSPRVRALWPDLDPAALGHDGIAIRTVGDDLILAGQPPRGTLYAVYTFLEDQVGIRWWSSTEQTIPARPTLEIGPLNQTYAPPLRVREAFYRDAQEGVFSARLKLNGHFHRVPAEYGGHYEILGWCHTFYQLLPPDRYFAEHPDWYSELNGRRTANGGQLCLTNAEMRAELVRQALGWIEKNPAAGMISIAQNDWHGACQCAACQAIVREEGSESGPLIRFVNAVAEEIEKHYPDFLIETLAYAYTRSAPRVTRPRDNVVVRLCSIECSWSQTLAEGAQNRPFRRDLEAWSAVAPKLYIWDYVTNFPNAMFPHPNLHVLADNVRTFVRHHTIGLFEQGDAYCSAGDFVRLRAWLLAHLMWDPSRDDAALIDEYLRGYYGPAAAPLAEYLSLRTEAVVRAGTYLRCFTDETASWLDLPTLNRATELFDQAEAAVRDDAVLLARVQRERLPLDLVWLLRGEGLRLQAQRDGAAYRGPTDFRAATEQFLERCAANKVEFRGEGRPFAPLADQLRARLRDPAPPPPDVAGLPADAWQDFQDHRFKLYGEGNWVSLVADPAASDGFAARLPAHHNQWAVQLHVDSETLLPGRYQVRLSVRCEAPPGDGNALIVGAWDGDAKAGLAQREVSIAESRDGYVTIDLGALELRAGCYLWVAPLGNAPQVTAIYVDRIWLVRAAP